MRPNLYDPNVDQHRTQLAGYRADRAALGSQAGTQRLGISIWILPPGQAAYPYHFHLTDEEAMVVLEGTPTLRTPEGTRRLDRGEVVAFGVGEQSAHQVLNNTDEEVRFLAISTSGAPDVVYYPDTGKIGAGERKQDGTSVRHVFRLADAVDYYDGMEPR